MWVGEEVRPELKINCISWQKVIHLSLRALVKDAGGAGAAFLEVAAAPMMGDAPPLEGEGGDHAFLVERKHLSFGNKLDQGMLPAKIEFCFFLF